MHRYIDISKPGQIILREYSAEQDETDTLKAVTSDGQWNEAKALLSPTGHAP